MHTRCPSTLRSMCTTLSATRGHWQWEGLSGEARNASGLERCFHRASSPLLLQRQRYKAYLSSGEALMGPFTCALSANFQAAVLAGSTRCSGKQVAQSQLVRSVPFLPKSPPLASPLPRSRKAAPDAREMLSYRRITWQWLSG